jgi:prepilin peptidase CpaA
MTAAMIVLVVLPALLTAAAVMDLISYKIPNVIPAAIILLFFAFLLVALASGRALSWNEAAWHMLAGTLGLVAGMALFAAGWIGGGDAKFFAAALLWLGWDALLDYALMASILGGALTLVLIALRRYPVPVLFTKQAWIIRLCDREAGVPYGIALALGALAVLPGTDVFQIALQS